MLTSRYAASVLLLFMLTLVAPVSAEAQVVNFDFGDGSPNTYSGQGALADPGNNYWNESALPDPLRESDGVTLTDISVSLSGGDFEPPGVGGLTNSLLRDYQFISTFDENDYVGTIAIMGLVPSTSYLIYVYSTGDNLGQAGLIELEGENGVEVQAVTSGVPSDQFIEGGNYVVMEVVSDAAGEINGTWRPFASASSGAINGLQIVADTLPPRVLDIVGAESPTVNSPGDTITVTVSFSEAVTLDQAGQLELQIEIPGTPSPIQIQAVHSGATSGTSLTFQVAAPATTTFEAKVVANSLQLLGGATLTEGVHSEDVILTHGEIPLPNDQISDQGLAVYPPVPALPSGEELDPSPHYAFRVRETGGAWQTPFAWLTKCVDDDDLNAQAIDGYYKDQIGGWSHTYANFEMANNVEVEVEITRLDENEAQVDIQTAVPHPRRKVKSWRVENGRAYVVIDQPVLLAVDIDGQLDDSPAPSSGFINDDAIHAVSIFANPFILDKPDLSDLVNVLAIAPGTIPPDNAPQTTFYFLPGIHQLFTTPWGDGNGDEDDFRLRSGKSYYIPGDAIVHGSMNNEDDGNDGQNIRIFGHGTLSGERIPHTDVLGIVNPDDTYHLNKPIRIANNARGSRVEGVTVTDSANHSIALKGGFNVDRADYNYVRWTKVFTWRANGDGVSPNGSGYLEDSFLRTQDDGVYIGGYGIRRMVLWSDVNGMALRGSNMLNSNPAPYRLLGKLLVEDIDILYARTRFGAPSPGRSVIGFPTPTSSVGFFPSNDNDGSHVVFRDIYVEDKFPTRTLFGWDMASGSPDVLPVSGVWFDNVRAASRNVDGETDPFLGTSTSPITGLIFNDVTLAGEHYDDVGDFTTNGFVFDFVFEDIAAEPMSYLNESGVGKWYIKDDWDSGVEPANNDIVNHTAVGDVLIVDAPAYAGSLNVSHAATAIVSIESGGDLEVKDQISVGALAPGELRLIDGQLTLLDDQTSSLSLSNLGLYLERGTLLWAGNHVTDIQDLFDDGAIVLGMGGADLPGGNGTLIGQAGGNELYASFNTPTVGFTTVRVVPEPSALLGIGAGVLALGALTRRRCIKVS